MLMSRCPQKRATSPVSCRSLQHQKRKFSPFGEQHPISSSKLSLHQKRKFPSFGGIPTLWLMATLSLTLATYKRSPDMEKQTWPSIRLFYQHVTTSKVHLHPSCLSCDSELYGVLSQGRITRIGRNGSPTSKLRDTVGISATSKWYIR